MAEGEEGEAAASSPEAASEPKEDTSKPADGGEAPAAATTNGEGAADGDAKQGDNNKGEGKGKPQREKREEVPIEELYDLSKPIPRIERPDKAQHEEALKVIQEAVDAIKEDRKKVQDKIDAAMNDPAAKARLTESRAEMSRLKNEKTKLIDEKKSMRSQLDAAKASTEKLIKDKKDARSNVKFGSIDEIDKEIAKLQRIQETTTMSLNEEKRLIKEMDQLQASKKFVSEIASKDAAMDGVREQRKTIGQRIASKDAEIDEVQKKIDAALKVIREISAGEQKKRDSLQDLFKQRDEYKKSISDRLKEKDALRDDFREKQNAWWNYQRGVKAQKRMQYEADRKRQEEEYKAYLAKVEEEEAKKIPYEAEQALCDYLADYLERTYLTGKSEDDGAGGAGGKKDDVVAVKDDPFAGMKPVSKKSEGEEYFGKGKGKKKRNRATKKSDGGGGGGGAAGPFTLSVDTFEQFGLISMTPPTSVDQVEASVKALREKKEWYKQQPRGTVPTATDIRKANEKAAAKLRSAGDGGGGGSKKNGEGGGGEGGGGKKGGGFTLSNDDFAPLGASSSGGGGGANASWGQKPAVAAAASAAAEEESLAADGDAKEEES